MEQGLLLRNYDVSTAMTVREYLHNITGTVVYRSVNYIPNLQILLRFVSPCIIEQFK